MGNIPSGTTINCKAYLTDKGREYLFNKNNLRFQNGVDMFEIKNFSLSDPDINYKLDSSFFLKSGEVPDISGINPNLIKSSYYDTQKYPIIVDGDLKFPSIYDDSSIYTGLDDSLVYSTTGNFSYSYNSNPSNLVFQNYGISTNLTASPSNFKSKYYNATGSSFPSNAKYIQFSTVSINGTNIPEWYIIGGLNNIKNGSNSVNQVAGTQDMYRLYLTSYHIGGLYDYHYYLYFITPSKGTKENKMFVMIGREHTIMSKPDEEVTLYVNGFPSDFSTTSVFYNAYKTFVGAGLNSSLSYYGGDSNFKTQTKTFQLQFKLL